MEHKINWAIFGFLALMTILDGLATFYGTIQILGSSDFAFLFAGVFALIIGFILVSTYPIFHTPKTDFLVKLMPLVWFIAFVYDVYTSFIGNITLLGGGSGSKLGLVVIITFLVCGSSIVISYIVYKK